MRNRECGSSPVNRCGSLEIVQGGRSRSSAGFTVMEMLLVITILGITMTIGLPRMSAGVISANVRGARITLVNMLARARVAATESNRVAVLKIEGDNAVILLRPRLAPGVGSADTLGAVAQLGNAYGVTVTGAIDSVRFDPRGLASGFGTGTSFQVSRYGTTETIRIDGLGRVTR